MGEQEFSFELGEGLADGKAIEDNDDDSCMNGRNGMLFKLNPPFKGADCIRLDSDGEEIQRRVFDVINEYHRPPIFYQEITTELLEKRPELFLVNDFLRKLRKIT